MPFLDSFKPGGGGGSPLQDLIALGSLFGPKQNVLDSRDFQATMDQADVNNRLNIGRSNSFLEGVTPTNAAQYNKYQDLTFQQDTDRQLDRMKDIGEATRMSPWEIAGVGGASPLPSPGGLPERPQQYMAQLTGAAVQAQNNKTQLAVTKMNNDTAKDIAAMQTGNGDLAKTQMQEILSRIPVNQQEVINKKAQALLTAAQQRATQAQEGLTQDQSTKTQAESQSVRLENALKVYRELKQLLPDRTLTITTPVGSYTTNAPQGSKSAAAFLGKLNTGLESETADLSQLAREVPAGDVETVLTALQDAAKSVLGALDQKVKDNPGPAKGKSFLENLF